MYKLLAYQITLQQRHQIVENIKVLSTLWPTILVFSVIAPIGPAATWLIAFTTNTVGSVGMFHITYNVTPIIMAFFCKYHKQKSSEVFPTDSVAKEMHLVKSPFGASLPTHVSQEIYFNDLRNQWN
uniref:G protein-coupled receptor n=1 Tax=Panagrolaimus sp. ES5 TaxID=591445 RepID=A0AC34F043_9BILA